MVSRDEVPSCPPNAKIAPFTLFSVSDFTLKGKGFTEGNCPSKDVLHVPWSRLRIATESVIGVAPATVTPPTKRSP